jgi:serine protease
MAGRVSRVIGSIWLWLAIAAGLAPGPGLAAPERGPLISRSAGSEEDPDGARVIVKYKALGSLMKALRAGGGFAGPQFAGTLAARHGVALRDGHAIEGRSQVIHGDRSLSSTQLAATLAADPDVEYAVPDLRRHALALPNDPLFAPSASISPVVGQWYLRAPDATLVSAIDAPAAWAITTGSAAIVVADVDTGVRFDHPDLAAKLLPGRNFVSANGVTGAGWSADASDPGDYTTRTNQCGDGLPPQPSSWHGTQTAGLLGAQTDNGIGMASVGYQVRVLPVRVLGPCGGYDSDIIAGMLWAGGLSSNPVANPNPARVINLSLGSSGSCTAAYADAMSRLTAAGVVVVAAAGNQEGLAVGTPANCSGVVAVTGVRQVGTKVGFSSIGAQVAIAAPAGNCVNPSGACLYPILTTTNSGTTIPVANDASYTNSSNYSVGTSFSTPLVAGTAALMLAANPALTPAQVTAKLKASARPFPVQPAGSTVPVCQPPSSVAQDECYCTTSTCGAGLLDAGAAVAAAAATAVPTASISASSASVVAGARVSFDGSGSTAPSGRTIASYQWAITSGASIASVSGSATGSSVSVATTGIGSFTIRLTVTDSAGESASASSTVVVNAPAAPTVRILASASVVGAGSSVTFDGSASAVASGLSIVSYQWSIASGAGLASFTSSTNAATATVATAGAASGSFTVQLTVTDSLGQQSSATSTVSVTPVGPSASIQVASTTVTVGSVVDFDGSGSTAVAGRTIAGYQWAITSGGAIAAFSGPTSGATAAVTTSGAGSFTVQLTVTDSAGATDTRATTISVNAVGPTNGAGAPAATGGGGGAMSGSWLLGLAAATVALAWPRRRRG